MKINIIICLIIVSLAANLRVSPANEEPKDDSLCLLDDIGGYIASHETNPLNLPFRE